MDGDQVLLRLKLPPGWRAEAPEKPKRRASRVRDTGSRSHLPGWPRGLPAAEAAAYVGMGVSTWRREVKEGRAPKPILLTPDLPVWDRHDLDAYLENKKAAEQDRKPNTWDDFDP